MRRPVLNLGLFAKAIKSFSIKLMSNERKKKRRKEWSDCVREQSESLRKTGIVSEGDALPVVGWRKLR